MFLNPRTIVAIRVTGDGVSQVILATGIAYDIALGADEVARLADADIAAEAKLAYTQQLAVVADVLAVPATEASS